MTPPLRITFHVDCAVEHAFAVWTERIGSWWPRDHTVSGTPILVVLEGSVGGRIYERTEDHTEHEWGVVTTWEPPTRLAYSWHLGRDAAVATEVEIQFVEQGPDGTRVEIEHRGWERLGEQSDEWRDRNQHGWDSLVPHYRSATTEGGH